jgi:hypothetical protein
MDSDKLENRMDELSSRLDNIQEKIRSQASTIESQASSTRWAVGFGTLLLIIILGLISNPTKRAHVAKIFDNNSFLETIGEEAIEYESCYAFSVTSVKGTKEPLTLGIFGHVFMKSDSFPMKE